MFLTYIIHCASAQFDPNLVFGHHKSSGDAHSAQLNQALCGFLEHLLKLSKLSSNGSRVATLINRRRSPKASTWLLNRLNNILSDCKSRVENEQRI